MFDEDASSVSARQHSSSDFKVRITSCRHAGESPRPRVNDRAAEATPLRPSHQRSVALSPAHRRDIAAEPPAHIDTGGICILMQKPRPAAPDGAIHLGSALSLPGKRGDKPAQCASGSGRTWKCTAMGFMPLPPSWSHGVRSPLEVHRPRPFQPALGSSMRPSRPLA
jgi:hypothetical protein